MLKNIRLHIEKDELKQNELDTKLAESILQVKNPNLNSFIRNIPSLVPILESSSLDNHSLFCNKYGEINIVDYGLGRTLYGFHPQQEVREQINSFQKNAPLVSVLSNSQPSNRELNSSDENSLKSCKGYINHFSFQPAPDNIECLVVLGIGLGHHLLDLLNNKTIKFLIIYEPELQYFKCSSLAIKWNKIFNIAKAQNTQMFLQIGKDGRDIIQDINELKDNTNISEFYLFKHYNHPVFNSIYKELSSKPWSIIEDQGINFTLTEDYNHYTPPWTLPVNINQIDDAITIQVHLFEKNLLAFKQYFPDIYQKFKDYKPKNWLPVCTNNGEINLIKKDDLTPWYSDNPKNDCDLNFENFNEQPNKDGLVLGYSGTKLAHYIHFKFVKETERLLEQAEEEIGALPENVASIIMFGVGVGYQIEKLLADHTVEKLFLCEPNTDFFYASLFAIDWLNIFEKIDKSGARIYLNIGDDGTNLFRDLLSQFYSIGPYILSNTYFYQSYYNASLNSAISQLREQLQVVISMGEYFDHAYYGIAHTKEGLTRELPTLLANPSEKFSYDDKEVPIFIVGNGPSLDKSIAAIKEWKDQAIVVSCGTALQALHRHGITPDFHAEIEQNRSTFDWAVFIGDLNYLKNITLISCNGIHPDTCDLYKNVLIAFKEGESSTVSALNILGRENYQVLQNSFPTVSNFACDLFSQLGFKTIYLLGVDLGFVSVKHHHSKSSGYYKEDGEEVYDYAEKNNTSLIVPGNFRPTVNTKHEFKVSKQVLEQVTSHKIKDQTFYNCSDGAKINGTLPIKPENLLIVATQQQKQDALTTLRTSTFSTNGLDNFVDRFEQQFSQSLLLEELQAFEKLLEKKVTTQVEVQHIINKQKEMLFASYKNGNSLLFYYLYGTVNYVNATLTKLLNGKSRHEVVPGGVSIALEEWKITLGKIYKTISFNYFQNYDTSSYHLEKRELVSLKLRTKNKSLLIISDSIFFNIATKMTIESMFPFITNCKVISKKDSLSLNWVPDYTICYHLDGNTEFKAISKNSSVIICQNIKDTNLKTPNISYLPFFMLNDEDVYHDPFSIAHIALTVCLSKLSCPLILPKFGTCSAHKFDEKIIPDLPGNYKAYNHPACICIFDDKSTPIKPVNTNSQTAGKLIMDKVRMKHLLRYVTSKMELNKYRAQNKKDLEKLLSQLSG